MFDTNSSEALAAERKGPLTCIDWWRGQDLNLRPSGCEPDVVFCKRLVHRGSASLLEWSTHAIVHPALDSDANSACHRQSPLGGIDPQHLPSLIVHLDPGVLPGSPTLTRPAPSRLIAVAACRVTVSRCQICDNEEAEVA